LGGQWTIRRRNPFLKTIFWLPVSKFLAEEVALERTTILGWEVNTRTFKDSLRTHKWRAWVSELRRLAKLPGRRANAKELETTIGRLN
jgi:hypothetical protein